MPRLPPPCAYRGALFRARERLHEAELDRLPAVGKILLPRRQRPHAMPMLGQRDHPGVDVKGPLPARHAHRFAQRLDVANQRVSASRQPFHGKAVWAIRHAITAIIRHLDCGNRFGLLCGIGCGIRSVEPVSRFHPTPAFSRQTLQIQPTEKHEAVYSRRDLIVRTHACLNTFDFSFYVHRIVNVLEYKITNSTPGNSYCAKTEHASNDALSNLNCLDG